MTMFAYHIAALLLCTTIEGFVREQAFSFSWRPTACILTPPGPDCSDGFDGTLDICGSRCYDRSAIEAEFKRHLRGIRQLELGVDIFTATRLRETLRSATVPQLQIFCHNTMGGVSLFREARICFTISQHNQICYQNCLDDGECGENIVLPHNVSAIAQCVHEGSDCGMNETLVDAIRGETKRRSIFNGVGVLTEKMDDLEKKLANERSVVESTNRLSMSVGRLERYIEDVEGNVTKAKERIRKLEKKDAEREDDERRIATTNNTLRLKAIDRRLESVVRRLESTNTTIAKMRGDVDRRFASVERRLESTNTTSAKMRGDVERRFASVEQKIVLLENQTDARIRECTTFLLSINGTLLKLRESNTAAEKILSSADRVGPSFWIALAAVFCGLSLIACMCYCIKTDRAEIC